MMPCMRGVPDPQRSFFLLGAVAFDYYLSNVIDAIVIGPSLQIKAIDIGVPIPLFRKGGAFTSGQSFSGQQGMAMDVAMSTKHYRHVATMATLSPSSHGYRTVRSLGTRLSLHVAYSVGIFE